MILKGVGIPADLVASLRSLRMRMEKTIFSISNNGRDMEPIPQAMYEQQVRELIT